MASKPEQEACFYARIGDNAGFAQAVDKEAHEQWEYQIPAGDGEAKRGRQRVRATARGEDVAYEETIKTPAADQNGLNSVIENTIAIDKEHFDAWKQAFGTTGAFKGRYVFLSKNVLLNLDGESIVLPEVKYQVDVFVNPAGEHSKWCKIDIELDHILEYLADKHPDIKKFDLSVSLSTLPIKPEDAFSDKDMSDTQAAAVRTLWDSFSHPLTKGDSNAG